jgi:hypothetical protein
LEMTPQYMDFRVLTAKKTHQKSVGGGGGGGSQGGIMDKKRVRHTDGTYTIRCVL